VVWSRHINPAWEAANGGVQPGMANSAAALFDAAAGTYVSKPMPQNLYGSGGTLLRCACVRQGHGVALRLWLLAGWSAEADTTGLRGRECLPAVSGVAGAPVAQRVEHSVFSIYLKSRALGILIFLSFFLGVAGPAAAPGAPAAVAAAAAAAAAAAWKGEARVAAGARARSDGSVIAVGGEQPSAGYPDVSPPHAVKAGLLAAAALSPQCASRALLSALRAVSSLHLSTQLLATYYCISGSNPCMLGMLCFAQASAPYLLEGRRSVRVFNSSTLTWTTVNSPGGQPLQTQAPHWKGTQASAACACVLTGAEACLCCCNGGAHGYSHQCDPT
jgi:hypothetical protein